MNTYISILIPVYNNWIYFNTMLFPLIKLIE